MFFQLNWGNEAISNVVDFVTEKDIKRNLFSYQIEIEESAFKGRFILSDYSSHYYLPPARLDSIGKHLSAELLCDVFCLD